jgi:hypothetical protein
MWARRWPGLQPRHSAWLVAAVPLDSESGAGLALVAAFARHTDSPERQRQIARTALSQLTDDSYVMRLQKTTWDHPV